MRNGTEFVTASARPSAQLRCEYRPEGRVRAVPYAWLCRHVARRAADATGLARPSLYAAFGDKRALYLAALARLHDRAERAFAGLGTLDLPLQPMVERMLLGAIDGYMSGEKGPSGCLLVGTATAESAADPEVRAALAKFLAMEDRCIEDLLVAAGSTRPAASAALVASVIHSLSVRARAGEPRAALDRIARDCAGMIV